MTIQTGDITTLSGLTARIINMLGLFDAILPHDRRQAAVFLNEAITANRELQALTGRLQPPVTLAVLEGVAEAAEGVNPPPAPLKPDGGPNPEAPEKV